MRRAAHESLRIARGELNSCRLPCLAGVKQDCNVLPRRFCAAVRPTTSIGAFDRGKLLFSEKLTAATWNALLAVIGEKLPVI